jgi:dihydropteroate synthase
MGIVNCTPDSFYDGGRYHTAEAAVHRGLELVAAGADIIDVGGESTRPGADDVEADQEAQRVVPVIERLARETKAVISVDTQKASVARRAMDAGASIINDVSSLADPDMTTVAAQTKAALALMHMKGTPRTMQQHPTYHDLFGEIIAYLRDRADRAVQDGVPGDRIIMDPGIGFGKTVAHNLELIRDLYRLRSLGRPILIGPSNKSFIGKVLDAGPEQRGPGTAVALAIAVIAGAHILRVHDVAAMKPVVDLAYAIALGEKWDRS